MTANKLGTLYGVGVGPGDPELVTLKALRILQIVPVVFVPVAQAGAPSLAGSIAGRYLDAGRQRLEELVFAMRADEVEMRAQWTRNAQIIAAELQDGRDAAFATEGDPTLYSTFGHLCRGLVDVLPEAPVVAIPGVSSVTAAACVARVPLVDRDERLAVLPASYERDGLRIVLESFDTIVLMKVSSAIDRVLDDLEEMELADQAVLVSRCGLPQEEVITDVRSLRGQRLDYFSTMIVRKSR